MTRRRRSRGAPDRGVPGPRRGRIGHGAKAPVRGTPCGRGRAGRRIPDRRYATMVVTYPGRVKGRRGRDAERMPVASWRGLIYVAVAVEVSRRGKSKGAPPNRERRRPRCAGAGDRRAGAAGGPDRTGVRAGAGANGGMAGSLEARADPPVHRGDGVWMGCVSVRAGNTRYAKGTDPGDRSPDRSGAPGSPCGARGASGRGARGAAGRGEGDACAAGAAGGGVAGGAADRAARAAAARGAGGGGADGRAAGRAGGRDRGVPGAAGHARRPGDAHRGGDGGCADADAPVGPGARGGSGW